MKKKPLLWILNKIKKHSIGIVLLTLSEALLSVCVVAFAYLSKGFLDSAIEDGIKAASGKALILALVVMMQIIMYTCAKLMNERMCGKITISLKNSLLLSSLKREMGSISGTHSGEILNRLFSDTAVIAQGVTGIVPTAAAIITRLAAVFAVLVIFDAYLIIAFCVMGALMYILSRILRPHMKKLHKRVQQAEDKMRAFFQEIFDRIVIIKAYGKEKDMAHSALKTQKNHYLARMAKAKLSTLVSSGFVLFFRAAYISVMIYCAYKLGKGDESMTFGTLTALLQLVSQVQQPFSALSGIMPRYYSMLASAERLMQLEENAEDYKAENAARIYKKMEHIELRDVTFNYGREQVLKGACAKIEKGSFTLLSGQTGAGKSTLFMLLLGLYPFEGSIQTDRGEDISAATRGLFAYVPQGNMLFSGTVRDNVCFAGNGDEQKLDQALKLSCSSEFVSKLPQGIDTPIGQEGSALSEGQAQRLAIARAIMSQAPILLMDEPTSALDDATEQQLLNNLKQLRDRTVIMISHKSAARDACSCELALENGQLRQVK